MAITDSVVHPAGSSTVPVPTIDQIGQSSFPREWTLADLHERLGGIPLDRVRLCPSPGLATEQDVVDVHARTGRLCELIDGVLVEKPMGFYESVLALAIGRCIGNYLKDHPLGIVAGEAGMVRISGQQIRIPDVSFIRWERLPPGRDRVPAVSPDLVVEVISESNTEREIQGKLDEYFANGTRLAWIIDPRSRTARIYRGSDRYQLLPETGTLDGAEVLPGFALELRQLFAELDRPGQAE